MKYIVDTSVWIEHIKKPVRVLVELLENDQAVTHHCIIGELACGSMKNRDEFLGNLKMLDRVEEVPFEEVLEMIRAKKLYSKGLGWIDCQILASAMVGDCSILTYDRALKAAAKNYL